MSDPLTYLTTVVRVFPDYADSVIWFAPGPIPYEAACISPSLADELSAWEDRFYEILDEHSWIRDEFRKPFDEEGLRLAEELSNELGAVFSVDYIAENGDVTRFTASSPGTNPTAVTAFTGMANRSIALHQRLDELRSSGEELRWVQRAHTTFHNQGKHDDG